MNPQIFKSFSSLIPSYILKITKFLGEISQFEFLVMTKKNIFAYKLFLLLNISHFNFFCVCENGNPLRIVTPFSPAALPLKVDFLSSLLFMAHYEGP